MKKKGRKRIDGNVILFPNLEKRLLDRGLEQLQEKNFSEAIQLFEEAKALAPEDSDIYVGLVLAYYEAGALQNAKQLAKEMLKEDIGDYFQTVDLYLMILVQLHEYDEIITTIEVLEEEREIPLDKQEHFSKLLAFSKRMADARTFSEYEEENEDLLDFEEPVNFSLEGDPNKQVLAIAELAHKNVRPYIEEVKDYLKSKDGHPFLKTMLLNILQEQEYEKEIHIEKFDSEKMVIPTAIVPIRESEQFLEIKQVLNPIEDKDPILFQQMLSLLERHLFLISPFELEPKDPRVWAASYHLIGLEFNGVEMLIDDMAIQYKVELAEMEKACSFIRKLEKISYPII
ncbi:tetratricopeptide repeat protein [Robertmurraya yapensis]|uniref:Tetratricopeptide repeat protein n=2 Tax=Bacillaceae TaxID=186817 RepID=A0A3S0I8V0_9BACI|nr:tetratricopeptide repeat protein [Bacillus yapensis]RTR27355.1 tetratricopeptide repeat protein [Bacillus yapensis]TKS94075.1 tetratricopeptide repeat protein [Bacillus yapensis]